VTGCGVQYRDKPFDETKRLSAGLVAVLVIPKEKRDHGNYCVYRSRIGGWIYCQGITPGDDPGGFIVTAIIGVAGALLGGFIAAALFDAHPLDEFFDISTWLTAIAGSALLLLAYRLVMDRNTHGRRSLST
jgi:uncharacterized membrane protein YeaQ/YmgE (transglycosylase-associated protein family)